MESTLERIGDLQRKFQAISVTVAKPRLIAIKAADANSLQRYVRQNHFICDLAQADMCSVDGLFKLKYYVNEQTSFVLTLRNLRGTTFQEGVNRIDIDLVNAPGNSIKGATEPLSQGQVKILLTPER